MSNNQIDPRTATLFGCGFNMEGRDRQEIWVPDAHLKRHMFVFGTTGVGKTRLCENLIEQDIKKNHSVVYFDPKGDQEIFTKIYEICRKTGRLEDLMCVTPVYPEYSAIIDPLQYYFMPDELVGNIIAGIQAGKEPFFRNVAKEITTAVILGEIELAKARGQRPVINIDKVRQAIRIASMKDTAPALRAGGTPEAEDVAGMLQDIIDSGQDYYNKVSSSLRTCLADLSFGNIGKIIGKADSNRFMRRLEEGKRVVMVVHTGSMLTREAGQTLGKVVLSMIHSFIGRVYLSNRKSLKNQLSIHIDEAQSLLYAGIEDMFAKVGSANVSIKAYAQSVNQLYAALTEPLAKSILDNTNTKVFLRCSDKETSEYVTGHFGQKTKLSGIYGNTTVTTKETEEDVLKATDILDLQPQEFYLMSYIGRYRGKTTTSWDPETEIVFPSTPSWQEAPKDKENTPAPPPPKDVSKAIDTNTEESHDAEEEDAEY